MTDGCNHLSTMKNGSHRKTEQCDKNITEKQTEMCHPVIQKWCMNAVPAERRVNHLLLETAGRETKQIM